MNIKKRFIFFFAVLGLLTAAAIAAQTIEKLDASGQPTESRTAEDVMKEMPQPVFSNPNEGGQLAGIVIIDIEIKEALSVEFYLRRPESLQEVYLGKAMLLENRWKYSWDTINIPNGDYRLFPKIVSKYGEYSGEGVVVKIANEVVVNEQEERIIDENIRQVEQIEETQAQETQNTTESIIQEGQDLTESDIVGIKESVKELTEIIKKEVNASSSDVEEIIKKKEGLKEDVAEKALTPTKSIQEKIGEEDKISMLEQEKRAKEEIGYHLEELELKVKELEEARREVIKKISVDSDSDGLPDDEEIRLGTNPFNPDSDADGFLDGDEIKIGYDPLKPGPAAKIIYQDPRKVRSKEADIYKVEKVSIVALAGEETGVKFEGKSRPHVFVTIYVFSEPFLVMVTRANENGYWEYILDKPLEEGPHKVYVAVTNNRGEITAKSDPFSFIKTPTAIAAVDSYEEKIDSPSNALQKSFAVLTFALIILFIGIALIIIGVLTGKNKKSLRR